MDYNGAQTADNTISEPPISEKVAQEAPKSFDDKKVRQSAQTVLEQTNYDPQIASLIEDNPELKYYNPINLKQKVQDLSKLSNEELSAKALSENNDIDNVVSRKILLENGPMLTTSVNESGTVPLNEYDEIVKEYSGFVDQIYDTTTESMNKPSTVVSVNNKEVKILREGPIKKEEIEEFLKSILQ